MNREIHVRFWESAGVRFPCATQPFPLRHHFFSPKGFELLPHVAAGHG